jgi:pimeloyl-ACP methyl ester carboxylesterase
MTGGIDQADFRDLVIVIPGILGSRLVRRNRRRPDKTKVVWDFSVSKLPLMLRAMASGKLVLEGDGIDPPDDGIEADGLFSYQLFPGLFGVDDYDTLLTRLRNVVSDRQVLTFPYDWRLSNRHAAVRLETFAGDALRAWKAESNAKDPKLWLIAHSMGGLVARYYCEHLGGAAHTRAIVTLGTPHRGSVNALDALSNGKRFGPLNLTPLVRSLPSLYELLPLYPAVRHGTGESMTIHRIAEFYGLHPVTGADVVAPAGSLPSQIAGVEREWLRRALQFHAAIREPAERRARNGASSPYEQRAIFNRRQPTLLSAAFASTGTTVFKTYPEKRNGKWIESDDRGDGTVPAKASVPIEWVNTAQAIPIAQKHAGLPATQEAQDSIANWLKPLDVGQFRGGPVDDDDVVQLDLPPSIVRGDTLPISVAAGKPTNATVIVEDMSTHRSQSQPVQIYPEPRIVEFDSLANGVHRVSVRTQDPSKPMVSDCVYVSDPLLG